jgi:hypothetical protein
MYLREKVSFKTRAGFVKPESVNLHLSSRKLPKRAANGSLVSRKRLGLDEAGF